VSLSAVERVKQFNQTKHLDKIAWPQLIGYSLEVTRKVVIDIHYDATQRNGELTSDEEREVRTNQCRGILTSCCDL
jgi:hypothetical protein